MVREAVATDATHVELYLTKPYNMLLYTLAVLGIVPEKAYGDDYGANPIGSGRYMLEQWDKGQQVILKANPDYYGEEPKMKRVVVAFMEEDAALAAARAGRLTSRLPPPCIPTRKSPTMNCSHVRRWTLAAFPFPRRSRAAPRKATVVLHTP